MWPDDKFGRSRHRIHNPRPRGPIIPLWLAVFLSVLLIAAAITGASHLVY